MLLFKIFFSFLITLFSLGVQASDCKDECLENMKNIYPLIRSNDTEGVYNILQNLSFTDPEHHSPALYTASFHGLSDVFEILYSEARIQADSEAAKQALLIASAKGHNHLVTSLLDKGVDPNIFSADNDMATLHFAIFNKHHKVFESLIKHQADAHISTVKNWNGLHFAATSIGSEAIAQKLIDLNVDAGQKTNLGYTPLHLSVKYINLPLTTMIVRQDVNVNDLDIYGRNSLHYLSYFYTKARNLTPFIEILQILIKNHIDLNVKDIYGNTPLCYSQINSKADSIAKLLIKAGAKSSACNKNIKIHYHDSSYYK